MANASGIISGLSFRLIGFIWFYKGFHVYKLLFMQDSLHTRGVTCEFDPFGLEVLVPQAGSGASAVLRHVLRPAPIAFQVPKSGPEAIQ